MIKFEHNTLVLNSIFSKDDVAEIDAFAEYIRNDERERIVKLLITLEESKTHSIWDYNDKVSAVIALIKGEGN